jgi:transposase
MLADELDYVVGVDTHRDQHAVAIVDARAGAVIAQKTTAASTRGYADAVRSQVDTRSAIDSGRRVWPTWPKERGR